jgi:formylglycine-generating enzyme required for sulfatase activity
VKKTNILEKMRAKETGLEFLRGGSWPDEEEENLNLSGRCEESKENGYKCYGFRCVIAPIAQK